MTCFCDRCGCAIYTQDDVGFDQVDYVLASEGAVPHVKYYYAPVHELICSACVSEEKAVPYCELEAAFQAWAEQEVKKSHSRAGGNPY